MHKYYLIKKKKETNDILLLLEKEIRFCSIRKKEKKKEKIDCTSIVKRIKGILISFD